MGLSSVIGRHPQTTVFPATTFPKVPQTAFPKSVSIADLLHCESGLLPLNESLHFYAENSLA